MKGLLGTLFCILLLKQVESYYITIEYLISLNNSPINIAQSELYPNNEFNYEVRNYTITLLDTITSDNDFPLKYNCDIMDVIVSEGITTLCSADLSDADGIIAALTARAMGIMDDEVCPTEETTFNQISVFKMDDANFDDLHKDIKDDDDLYEFKCTIGISNYFKLQVGITEDSDWEEPDDNIDPDENQNNIDPDEDQNGIDLEEGENNLDPPDDQNSIDPEEK